jgi:hypothetical protein
MGKSFLSGLKDSDQSSGKKATRGKLGGPRFRLENPKKGDNSSKNFEPTDYIASIMALARLFVKPRWPGKKIFGGSLGLSKPSF